MIRISKSFLPGSVIALLLCDLAVISGGYVLAVHQTVEDPRAFLLDQAGGWKIALVAAILLAGMYLSELYGDYQVKSRLRLVQQICVVVGSAFLLEAFLNYAGFYALPRSTMMLGSLYVLVTLPAVRLTVSAVAVSRAGARRILFLGTSPAVREMIAYICERPQLGATPVGFLDDGPEAPQKLACAPRLGGLGDLRRVVGEKEPHAIVVGAKGVSGEDLLDFRLAGIQVDDAVTAYASIFHRLLAIEMAPARILSLRIERDKKLITLQTDLSRGVGIVLSVAALPLLALLAIILRLTSPGPALVRRNCTGLDGTPFRMFEFGVADTRFSRWMARMRLHQLPRLINVARGEMALVGPRPERVEFAAILAEKVPFYSQRHCVKPGMTGWAQIHQAGQPAPRDVETLEYDLCYIGNKAPWLDLYILLKSAKANLLREN